MSLYQLIRISTAPDWTAYHDIRRGVLFTGRGRNNYAADHPDNFVPTNHPLLLKFDGQPIGTTRLDEHGAGIGIVRLVAIKANAQGQGHGRVLAAQVEDFARGQGIHTFYVNAAPEAVGYYEKMNWQPFAWDISELHGIASDCRQHKKHLAPPVLETPRLRLRPIRAADAPAVADAFISQDMVRYLPPSFPWPYRLADAESFLALQLGKGARGEAITWAMTLKATRDDRLIGLIDLFPHNPDNNRGFWLNRDFWGTRVGVRGLFRRQRLCFSDFKPASAEAL